MSLRVGYINIQGLNKPSWDACHRLLHSHFDYLFVAETWFVNHERYALDRRFVASTPRPPKNLIGRSRGGIYLLGTYHARSKVDRVECTEHSLTFYRNKQSYTGVYFPPATLGIVELAALLETFKHATVILGDINTRFKDPLFQAGHPGPPERVRVFQAFLTKTHYQHLKPRLDTTKLTTDHCFMRASQTAILQLLDNTTLKIKTDHTYTLSLKLGAEVASVPTTEKIYRFQIGRLLNMKEKILQSVHQKQLVFDHANSVDEINTKLVRWCQQIQERTVGETPENHVSALRPSSVAVQTQTLAASIRLYKQASQGSQENEIIFPTEEAQRQQINAVRECTDLFKQRWTGEPFCPTTTTTTTITTSTYHWTQEQLVTEIKRQDPNKSCGADGIHIQFLKLVQNTQLITWLLELYNTCLKRGETPRIWNRSEIYLLAKDPHKRRDAKNLRPISIICIFRKVFERLLLRQAQSQPWAQLHPAQAGFRRSYSTLSNAAVVHGLLASKARSTAVFLDLKSAFDVVDHGRLDAKLAARGCPEWIRRLIQSLMFVHLESRLLINQQVTPWFSRSQGVLQGSPLSPWLFNLFIDDLLWELNADALKLPICLFYADDGVLLADAETDLEEKLGMIEQWTVRNAIFLNPTKCAVITSRPDFPPLAIYNQVIPQVEQYTYLGFPVTATGIDFPQYLTQRITAAVGRARWLGVQSNPWGPAHRLRVYKQFLAPMFEYGAPLVWAWAKDNQEAFDHATSGFKDLMGWISNSSDSRFKITANLCGLSSLKARFQRLRTAYQLILDQLNPTNPLKQLLDQSSRRHSFLLRLNDDSDYIRFKQTTNLSPTVRTALTGFLRRELQHTLHTEALKSHLTSLIPIESRQVPGLFLADISLAAPVQTQSMLLQYRTGMFMFKTKCVCKMEFGRGHETCPKLNVSWKLNRYHRVQKQKTWSKQTLLRIKFTKIDFLLNSGRLKEVGCILSAIRKQLRQVYRNDQLEVSIDQDRS